VSTIPEDAQMTIAAHMNIAADTTVFDHDLRAASGALWAKYYRCQPYNQLFGVAPAATDADIRQRAAVAVAVTDYNALVLDPFCAAHPVGDPLRSAATMNPMIAEFHAFVNDRLASMGLSPFYH